MKRLVIIATLVLTIGPLTALAKPAIPSWRDHHPWSTEVAQLSIGGLSIQAELADTPELRSRGLGYRDGLEPGTGMLFNFFEPSVHTFWMKGMRFCLDIIWIENGRIIGAAENACPEPGVSDEDLTRYPSGVPVTYVLEVEAGAMAANGWGPGTPVEIMLPDAAQTP
jgi:uncharacterized membrane protein (UPF0127 family)